MSCETDTPKSGPTANDDSLVTIGLKSLMIRCGKQSGGLVIVGNGQASYQQDGE
jgi:hypothetical protein